MLVTSGFNKLLSSTSSTRTYNEGVTTRCGDAFHESFNNVFGEDIMRHLMRGISLDHVNEGPTRDSARLLTRDVPRNVSKGCNVGFNKRCEGQFHEFSEWLYQII